ncbi:MAG TPA: glycosyltransferase family 39 protein [Aggregatilineales bacterium]|nr:glycosyltransferase family 39 protein [Aggregatilineales bacterium]
MSLKRITPILAILLLASAVRIVNAGHWPVWTDEGWSTWAASDHHLDAILAAVSSDRHPPLYFLTLSAWWTLAGDSRIALRFLGIASGLLGIAVVYRIGLDWFGQRAALYAALLLSVLRVAIYYSQEIRHYGWLMLAVSLMTLFFLRYLRRPRPGMLVLYCLSITFMFYSLYIGVLVLGVQVVIGLFVWRGSWRSKAALLAAWGAAIVLYIPWLLVISRQLGILSGGIDGFPTSWTTLITLLGILFGAQFGLTVALYLLGVLHFVEPRATGVRMARLAHLTIALSGGGLFAFMFFANMGFGMLSARTMVYLTPMLVLISGYGLSLIQGRAQIVLTLVLAVASLSTTEIIQPRLDSNLAAQALAAEYTPGDLVILENGWDDNAVRYEVMVALPNGEQADIIRTLPWVNNRDQDQPVLPHVEDAIKAHRRVWVVNWYQPSQVMPYLSKGGDGFAQVMSRETPIGDQYKSLYTDQKMRVVLFERPDVARAPQVFGDLLALRDSLVPPEAVPSSALHVDLWWSAQKALPLDYSVGVFLQDSTGLIREQNDEPPGGTGSPPTSQWQPQTLHFDRHTLSIPGDLPAGDYRIGVHAYWYGDNKALPIAGQDYLIIGTVTVKSSP